MKVSKVVTGVLVAGAAVLGTAGAASATPQADGVALDSPGVASGNLVQVPVHIPVNVSGNSINVVGVDNDVYDNLSENY